MHVCVSAKAFLLFLCVWQKRVCAVVVLFLFFFTKCPTNVKRGVESGGCLEAGKEEKYTTW